MSALRVWLNNKSTLNPFSELPSAHFTNQITNALSEIFAGTNLINVAVRAR